MGWKDRFRRGDKGVAKTEDVLIVVLCGGSNAHASLLQLANECDRFSAMQTHRFTLHFQPITASPQELARNTACGVALEKLKRPTDTLLMIDNDMIQHGWRSLRILDTPDYDIAGALQYMWLPRDYTTDRGPEARPCVFNRRPEGVKGQECVYPQPGERAREVDRVGSGFMAIKRRVLADERMLIAPGYDPPALWRNVFDPNYVRIKGLDMDFCDRAKALGHRIIVNWQSEVGHNKTANVNEIDEYAKSQFIDGYERGMRHALHLASQQGRQGERSDGGPGPHGVGDSGLGEVGMGPSGEAASPSAG